MSDSCHVCLDDFARDVIWACAQCTMRAHLTCAATWFREHPSCPVCKQPVSVVTTAARVAPKPIVPEFDLMSLGELIWMLTMHLFSILSSVLAGVWILDSHASRLAEHFVVTTMALQCIFSLVTFVWILVASARVDRFLEALR